MTRFVLEYIPTLSPKRAQLSVSALRSFFRFLYQRGELATDLAGAIPAVANWRLSQLPKSLEPGQVEQILQSCNQTHWVGQRDYTVLLLLARLGLRAGEVVHLSLDDIDWHAGLLNIRGKGGQVDQLPLPVDVGEALATYLRDARPPCATRRVFVRMRAPREGFASSVAIDSIVRRALQRAGLEPPCKGAHLLRHTLATGMLRNGACMAEISQLLRHRLAQTTEIYAKVDPSALGALAQPWPGRDVMSALSMALAEYLTVRRALGFKLYRDGLCLAQFVHFAEAEEATFITRDLALRWATQPARAMPAYWASRLTMVRQFARYCSALDARTEIPPVDLLPFRFRRKPPYLYSDEEICRLLHAAAQLPSPRELRTTTYTTLFALLVVTGMRISEPIALNRNRCRP